MYNDTVSDLITRIRNASMSGKEEILARNSKLVASIAETLKNEGFLSEVKPDGHRLTLKLNTETPLLHIKRLSRPSIRTYVSYTDIPRPRSGLGTVILSTPKGVLTGRQARKQKVGGELICEVW